VALQPVGQLDQNRAWLVAALTASTLFARLRQLALDGDLAKAEPKRCATVSSTPAAAWYAAAASAGSKSPPPGSRQLRS
jgi:hypothetical protein